MLIHRQRRVCSKGVDYMSKGLFLERLTRMRDALALKEPDRVPCAPMHTVYPYLFAGYTMAEVLDDAEKAKNAMRRYLNHFQPDAAYGYAALAGMGPLLEKMGAKWHQWAGQPGTSIDKVSMRQYEEKPYLTGDEYPEMLSDYTGWLMKKYLPRGFKALEPMAGLSMSSMRGGDFLPYTPQFAKPEVQEMFKLLGEIGLETGRLYAESTAFNKEIEEMGFPLQVAASATAPFDQLSDQLRGAIDTQLDLYSQPDNVMGTVESFFPETRKNAVAMGLASSASLKMVLIPINKGMDGFMSDEHYRSFYWDTLLRLINGLIDAGLTPWVYTEGPYDARVECLMDVPKGKTLIHFEQADMRRVKKLLGDKACISGGISSYMLKWGSKETVIEKVKENLDTLAPGGGFIFDLGDTMGDALQENVEAMFETVRGYGKY